MVACTRSGPISTPKTESTKMSPKIAAEPNTSIVADETLPPVSASTSPKSHKIKLNCEDFEFSTVIGEGSYGYVRLAWRKSQPNSGLFAVKILDRKKILKSETSRKFMLDEKKAAEFVKHDFIIKFHFAFQTQSSFFIGMEYVPGGDLLSQLKQHGTLSEDDAKFYVAEVTLALEYLHKNNIIHRDVKPENILIARDGHIRLADFGLSKFLDLQNGQTTKRLCGTVEYMAPEMFRKTGYSTSVDWWALGILTYDVTQGQTPFLQDLGEQPETIFNIVHKEPMFEFDVSETAKDFIKSLLHKDPASRLGSEGSEQVKNHPFLAREPEEWKKVANKQLVPPIMPTVRDEKDVSNFDDEFTEKSIQPPRGSPAVDIPEGDELSHFDFVSSEFATLVNSASKSGSKSSVKRKLIFSEPEDETSQPRKIGRKYVGPKISKKKLFEYENRNNTVVNEE